MQSELEALEHSRCDDGTSSVCVCVCVCVKPG